MACISRKTVTHLISHNQKLQLDPCDHSLRETFFLPKLTVAPMMVKVEFSLVGLMRRPSSPLWIAFVPDNEHGGSLMPVSKPYFHFFLFFFSSFVFFQEEESHILYFNHYFLPFWQKDGCIFPGGHCRIVCYCWCSRFLLKSAAFYFSFLIQFADLFRPRWRVIEGYIFTD